MTDAIKKQGRFCAVALAVRAITALRFSLFLLVVLLVSPSVYAEGSVPVLGTYKNTGCGTTGGVTAYGATSAALCADATSKGVTGYYCYSSNGSTLYMRNSAPAHYYYSSNLTCNGSYSASGYCPANSILSGGSCLCDSGYSPASDGKSCEVGVPLTAIQQAAQAAQDAAIAAGHSAGAAQAAEDAVLARPEYDGVCSSCQVGVGETAATAYDYSAIEGASAAIAADTAAKSGLWYAGGIVAGALDAQAQQLSQTAVQAHIAGLKAQAILSTIPTAPEVLASVAAAGLTVTAGALALAGAPAIAPILALSGALHSGILAANIDTANPLTAATVNNVLAGSVGSNANPFQVQIISKSALTATANTAVTATDAALSAGTAVAVITAPKSNWHWQDQPQPVHEAAATAGATAAVVTTQAAAPPAAVAEAVDAAVQAAYAGLSPEAAAVAAQAAATVSAAGYTSGQAQTAGVQAAAGYTGGLGAASAVQAATGSVNGLATESTLDKILAAIKSPWADPVETLGAVPGDEAIPTESPQFTYTPEVFASSAGCPAPIVYSIGFGIGQKSISFQPFCDFATTVRPLFLAMGAIAAFIIFAGLMGL
ncbi:MAG: virulence factor TspB C-terminal domain-related protein [Gallionella sp.]|nr:virulence factor TspB C-terminal domain-related protein [Gallionella sp.]